MSLDPKTDKRVRKILRKAITHTSSTSIKAWIRDDPRGYWEKVVIGMLEVRKLEPTTLSVEDDDEVMAMYVALTAIEADISRLS